MGNHWMHKLYHLEVWTDQESRRLSSLYNISQTGNIHQFFDLETNKGEQLMWVFESVMNCRSRVFGMDSKNFDQFASRIQVQTNNHLSYENFAYWFDNGFLRRENYGSNYVIFLEEKTIGRMYQRKPQNSQITLKEDGISDNFLEEVVSFKPT